MTPYVSYGTLENRQPKCANATAENLHKRFRPFAAKRLSRRLLLEFVGFNSIVTLHPVFVFAAPMPDMKQPAEQVIR